MLNIIALLNIFCGHYFYLFIYLINKFQRDSIFCNIIKVFTVTFDHFKYLIISKLI